MSSTLDYALIPTGSPGAGKSTLIELLVGKSESFVSQMSARGVAANVICPINFPNGPRAVHVFDIPGVVKGINRDLEEVFAMSRIQIVLSFIGSEGGRPIAADVRPFLDVKEAFGLRPESVLFVFNRSPKFESTEEHKQHQADFLLMVSSAINIPKERMQFVFIDARENADDLECEQAMGNRERLYTAISRCSATVRYEQVKEMEFDSKAAIQPNTEEGGGETMPQWYRPFNEMFRDVVILESAAASAQSKAKVVVFGTVAQYVSERWGIQASCSLVYGPLKREPICFISIHPTLSDNKLSPGTLCTELSSHFSDETSLAIQVIAASVTRDKLLNMEFLSLKNDMWDGLLDGLQPPEHYLTQFPVAFECNVFV
eukprot:gene40023-48762_t